MYLLVLFFCHSARVCVKRFNNATAQSVRLMGSEANKEAIRIRDRELFAMALFSPIGVGRWKCTWPILFFISKWLLFHN